VLQIQYQELDYYRNLAQDLARQVESSEKSHKDLTNKLSTLSKSHDEQLSQLIKDKKELMQQLSETRGELENSKLCEEELKIELETAKELLNQERKANQELRDKLVPGSSAGCEFDAEFFKLREALQDSLDKFDQVRGSLAAELDSMEAENKRLQDRISEQNGLIESLTSRQDLLQTQSSLLQSDLARCQNELKAMDELESQNQALKDYSDQVKAQNDHYANSIKNLSADNRNLACELSGLKEKTNSQIQQLSQKVQNLEGSNKTLFNKAKDLENEVLNQHNQNSMLSKRLVASNESMKAAYDEISKYQDELFEKQKKTESELEFIANYTLKTSQDHLDQERKMKKLGDIIGERDSELSILREMIGQLQKPKPSYQPVKDDFVDQALAEYLNSRPEPMEVNFIREDNGTYLFGSKRVFIKIENGKIISKT
jgi:chromosome segregation ATPase